MNMSRGAAALLSLTLVVSARAEDGAPPKEGRLRLSGSFAGTAGQFGSEAAFGASVGYRLSRRFAIDVELTGIPDSSRSSGRIDGVEARALTTRVLGPSRIEPGAGRLPTRGTVPAIPAFGARSLDFSRSESEALLGTANLRAEFRADNERVRPYLTGGFGLAHQDIELETLAVTLPASGDLRQRPEGRGGVFPAASDLPTPARSTQNRTDLAFVFGGGLSVRLVKGLFADADARYFRLLDPGRNVGRFGGGLSYRF